jgi:acyl-CoA thioesterase I
MKQFFIISGIIVLLIFSSCSSVTKIACVGDSITEGAGLAWQSNTSYPVILQSLLGQKYSVLNLGRSATTLQRKGDFPYWSAKEFYDVFALRPNVIVIKLGTNDTKPENWNAKRFATDYQALVDTFKTIPGHPRIYVCLPVPACKDRWGINDSTITAGVIPIVEQIAKTNGLKVIDLYHGMRNECANFPDGIHPNENGASIMAGIIAGELKK